MKKNLSIIFLIIFVTLATIFVSVKRPAMHKQAIITDSNYVFVEEKNSFVDAKVANVELNNQDIATNITHNNSINIKQPEINIVEKPTTKAKIDVTDTKTSAPMVKKTVVQNNAGQNQIKQTAAPKVVVTNKETKSNLPKQNDETNVEKKTNVVQEKAQPTKETTEALVPAKKVLTESEEIIAWNKWRSDLQNQVMRDTKIGAPIGTGFRFSFTVDKYGNMSNIKVWSTNSVYTDLAVRVIKPVLTSYQREPILVFPEGTKRVITNVTGGFVISTKTEYSTPSDYSDYEKVKRTQYN